MCAPTWTSTVAPSRRGIRISRSRLRLILRRCRTATTVQQQIRGERPPTCRQILPLAFPRGNGHTTTDSLALAQQQAIRHWRAPRHAEYVTLAKRTRTFYDRQWACEGKPSAESIAAAGFFYDSRSLKIFKSYISNFINFRVSCSYLNFKLSNIPQPLFHSSAILHFKYPAHI